jgi:hypothetical protein
MLGERASDRCLYRSPFANVATPLSFTWPGNSEHPAFGFDRLARHIRVPDQSVARFGTSIRPSSGA